MGWVKIINRNAVPDNLPEENCPECAGCSQQNPTWRRLSFCNNVPFYILFFLGLNTTPLIKNISGVDFFYGSNKILDVALITPFVYLRTLFKLKSIINYKN